MKRKKIWLIIPLLIIMIFSILDMFNAPLLDSINKDLYFKQIIWFGLTFVIILLGKKIKLNQIFGLSFIMYIINVILLVLVLFFGKEIHGARAWFNFYGISFQPSELMRFNLALLLTSLTNKQNFNKKNQTFYYLINTLIIFIVPSLLVFLEPDTGAVIFYFIITLSIIFNSDINKKWLFLILVLLLIFLVSFAYIYFYKKEFLLTLFGSKILYRMDRIVHFTNNSSYQMENALTVVSCATLWGTGLGKILLYIPEGTTDFIFAFTIGNFGLISGLVILICYFTIDIFLITLKFKNQYRLFLNAFIASFIFQQFYNILMNLNLLPIMGIPLPFLSYGGSTIIVYALFLSLILKMI
jgi:rod shape determining protein RodA